MAGQEYRNKRVVVMGLGRFGGGIGVTRWLAGQGARVHVTDLAPEAELAKSLEALRGIEFTHRLGGHDEADLEACDLLVVSPAVDKRASSFFKAAIARGIPWTSEMNLFLERCPGRIVGITGTVGKSTTTAMIGAVLSAAERQPSWQYDRVWLGGNIGKSLLEDLPEMTTESVVVLELSSFQLEDAGQIRKSPWIAVVTNLKDNHLDRHGTMEAYSSAKGNIYRFQSADDWVVMPQGCGVEQLPAGWEGRKNLVRYGVDPGSRRVQLNGQSGADEFAVTLQVPGMHNLQNAAAALAVATILGVSRATAAGALSEFAGLEHRLEFVREVGGVKYYNDSKATTPEAAMTSLAAFECGVIMIVGGSDKGSPFSELGRTLRQQAKAVIGIGQTRDKILNEVRWARGKDDRPRIETADSFEQALHLARESASPGDVVLLSPACASYDWFRNYEHRGEEFKRIVGGW